MQTINIIIADDHKLVREGFISLLKHPAKIYPIRISVLAEAGNGRELVDLYFKLKPDLIIIDLAMPVLSGIKAFKEIKNYDVNIKALFLSMHEDEAYIYHIIKAGGMGLVGKSVAKEELHYAVKKIYDGEIYFGKQWTESKLKKLVNNYSNTGNPEKYIFENDLTERETEIIKLIESGLCSDEIARKLFISKRTVDTHRSNIIKKLNLKTEFDLYKFAAMFIEFNIN
ncbi:MAG: response regulator transcription factor [Ignavibacteriales bacterium]|nr:response regulator transcription factor [Ignavibacteriales bacterium]